MLFNSLSFVVFLVIVLALYYLKLFNWTNKKRMLLIASYVFYGLWNPPLVILLWISTMVDWVAGKKLAKEENQKARNLWLLLSMSVNLGFLAFSGQIFFDFAGYSTCAIGIALMLGMVLPDNFRYPYAALGFSDLWNRWHITLSSWLRDYLYIPLGGNRFGVTRMYAALMITMLLGGLWHGAAWTFMVWGGLHGVYLILEKLQKRYIPFKITVWNGMYLAFVTFTCVNFTWVFFRAREFKTAWNMITSMLFLNADGEKILQTFDILKVCVVIGLMFICHWFMRNTSLKEVSLKMSPWVLGIVWAFMFLLIAIAQGSGEQFIYFQF
jgi:alginate O-acetyltransferase complex protein AlgI